MQTRISNKVISKIGKHSLLAGAFLLLVIAGAKIDLDLGGVVSFTLQTLFLGLAYYYLPLGWRLLLILTYLGLGIAGVPVFNGGTGCEYFSSWPLGFFIGFVLAAFILVPKGRRFVSAFSYFLGMHLVIVLLGVLWMFYYSGSSLSPMEVTLELLPGAIIKSLVGTGVVFGISKVFR